MLQGRVDRIEMVQVVEIGLLKFFAEYDRTPELQEICNVMGKNESNRW